MIPSQTTLPTDQDGRTGQLINPYSTNTLTTGLITDAFTTGRYVRFVLNADGFIRISKEATIASAVDIPMTEGVVEYFFVKKTQRISVLGATLTYTLGAGKDEIF